MNGNIRSYTATGNTALVGAQANFTVTQLHHKALPEPATMLAIGTGLAALLARRRRK